MGVTHILNLGTRPCKSLLPVQGMVRYVSECGADEFATALPHAVKFIHDAVGQGGVVLVVCGDEHGCSTNGPVTVVAYLACTEDDMSIESALKIIRDLRPLMNPEEAALAALIECQDMLPDKSSPPLTLKR